MITMTRSLGAAYYEVISSGRPFLLYFTPGSLIYLMSSAIPQDFFV
jgi:hypothetical protein